jgi:hypothetical protein
VSPIRKALEVARSSAVHFEARDVYMPDDPDYLGWVAGKRFDPAARYSEWFELIAATVARGVQVRRARIVSEPVTDYIRFEYDVTAGLNVAAGEQVRWLPRRRTAGLLVPALDCWIFDDETVIFNHFAGDGSWPGEEGGTEVCENRQLARRYAAAFDEVWARGIDHADYTPV